MLKEDRLLLYQTTFIVEGLDNPKIVNKVNKAILGLKGVKKLEINWPNKITITYDPTMIIPSTLNSKLSGLGLKLPGG